MKITFLGTGTSQGVPVIGCDCAVCASLDYRDKRLRTAAHIAVQGRHFIIDTGPDFRQQMLTNDIPRIDAVLYTHQHRDHTAGLDDIRPYYFRQGMEPMPIYARHSVLKQLEREFAYIFQKEKYPGVPSVAAHTIENAPFNVAGVSFTPIEVMHYKLPVFGFRTGDFTYITDANYIAPEELEKARGTEVLVLNALQKEAHISHFTLDEAVEVAKEIGARRTYLTHLSHRMGTHAQIEASLPENVFLAYDGLAINL